MATNPENQEIRVRIRNRRLELHMTLQQVADLAGLTVQKVNGIESGEREIKAPEIAPLSMALRCSLSYLLTGREETSRSALEETGLYQSTLNRLQVLKPRPDFAKIREVFDVLAKYPAFLDALHAYILDELTTITIFDPDTQQLKTVNVMSGEPEPENPNFPRLKYLPSEYARLQILDWLTIIRKKEQSETAQNAPSAPSRPKDEQKPV